MRFFVIAVTSLFLSADAAAAAQPGRNVVAEFNEIYGQLCSDLIVGSKDPQSRTRDTCIPTALRLAGERLVPDAANVHFRGIGRYASESTGEVYTHFRVDIDRELASAEDIDHTTSGLLRMKALHMVAGSEISHLTVPVFLDAVPENALPPICSAINMVVGETMGPVLNERPFMQRIKECALSGLAVIEKLHDMGFKLFAIDRGLVQATGHDGSLVCLLSVGRAHIDPRSEDGLVMDQLESLFKVIRRAAFDHHPVTAMKIEAVESIIQETRAGELSFAAIIDRFSAL